MAHISAIYKFTNMPPDISWYQIDNTQYPVGTKLYASPPDQTAKIKELEAELFEYKVNSSNTIQEQLLTIKSLNKCLGGEGSLTTDNLSAIGQLENDVEKLQKQNEKLREALEFYAERKHYSIFNDGNSYSKGNETYLKDDGEVARVALATVKGE